MSPPPRLLRVAWVGPRPWWLEARHVPVGAALVEDVSRADVAHVAVQAPELGQLRRRLPASTLLVFQPDAGATHSRASARHARAADLIVSSSIGALHELITRRPELAERVRLFHEPLDLVRHAPADRLVDAPRRGRDLRRFRRLHRLAPKVILYAGPYSAGGGLDLAVDAVVQLREQGVEARLAAIPVGEVDGRYFDAVERRALTLGQHAVIEWSVVDDELPYWYACADVVCAPNREPISMLPALHAAAAGAPFVGTGFALARAALDGAGEAFVDRAGDVSALTRALRDLLANDERRQQLGAKARRWAEDTLTPAAAVATFSALWREAWSRTHAAFEADLHRRVEDAEPAGQILLDG